MSYKIIPTESFKAQVRTLQKKYPRIRQDLKELNQRLKQNPKSGKALGKGVYKLRVKSSDISKGKRGGCGKRAGNHHVISCPQTKNFSSACQ